MAAFFSSKKFGPISVAHRQWRDSGHCSFIHGYGRIVEITFGCNELDDRGWVFDFGGLKQVRAWIEKEWDHRTLIAHDDPYLAELQAIEKMGVINLNVMSEVYGPGIEQSCQFIMDHVDKIISSQTHGRCWVEKVQIWEHENNSAQCVA